MVGLGLGMDVVMDRPMNMKRFGLERMHRLGTNREGKSRGNRLTQVHLKIAAKTVCE